MRIWRLRSQCYVTAHLFRLSSIKQEPGSAWTLSVSRIFIKTQHQGKFLLNLSTFYITKLKESPTDVTIPRFKHSGAIPDSKLSILLFSMPIKCPPKQELEAPSPSLTHLKQHRVWLSVLTFAMKKTASSQSISPHPSAHGIPSKQTCNLKMSHTALAKTPNQVS